MQNSFFIEVAYIDNRPFDNNGAFNFYTDIGLSEPGVLQPVLREAQQVVMDGEIVNATSGDVTIGLEGSSSTFVATLAEIAASGLVPSLQAALEQFGYIPSDFKISTPSYLSGENGDDFGYEIRYIGGSVGNVDLPDLTFNPNFDVPVEFSFIEYSPLLSDGVTPNYEALPFNVDTRSRTLNNNREFYDSLVR
ncbi:MAG: hypothetical protein AAF347_05085, partial [Pseudomonadota bacterium]